MNRRSFCVTAIVSLFGGFFLGSEKEKVAPKSKYAAYTIPVHTVPDIDPRIFAEIKRGSVDEIPREEISQNGFAPYRSLTEWENSLDDPDADEIYEIHTQNVNIDPEQMQFEIGKRPPYARYVNFPVELAVEYNEDLVFNLETDKWETTKS